MVSPHPFQLKKLTGLPVQPSTPAIGQHLPPSLRANVYFTRSGQDMGQTELYPQTKGNGWGTQDMSSAAANPHCPSV